ncbi:MAG: hypothetical protein RIS09_10 [Actinomycetota bacterium]
MASRLTMQLKRLWPKWSKGFSVSSEWERIWAPHRVQYIRAGTEPHEKDCPFCRVPKLSDDEGLIVFRGVEAFVVMNLYPYNTGHVMVCPYRHFGNYDEAQDLELEEIALLTQKVVRVLRLVSQPAGFNIGMNQGFIAGAGIAGHLHQHIVPRWQGDSNFMPVIGHTKVMPELLEETRALLANAWHDA